MAHEIIQISARKLLVKILLLVMLLLAGTWSYFVVRWYIGNTLAEYFNPAESNLDAAQLAASLAPNDPLTHWRMAHVSQRARPLDQQAQTILEYEQAVKLSPYDYRLWMSLGTAHGQSGDPAKAEMALRRAVELAPSYSYPRWYLGNFLLRNARYDEAFAELRLASEADPDLRPQQFNLIWAVYGDDPEGLKKAVGQNLKARAQFALYLVERHSIDAGLRLWNDMSGPDKNANRDSGAAIITAVNKASRYHDALKVWNEMTGEKYHAEVGSIFDSSFEEIITYDLEPVFGWQVKGAPNMEVSIDPARSHSGSRSLRLVFEVSSNIDTINVLQLVPVVPNTEYDFECFVSTDKLQSGSTPQVQIVNATDGTALVSSAQAPIGTTKWSPINLSFKTGEKLEAVIVKIVRISCTSKETPTCPIYGSIWYDDFTLKRRN